MSAAQPIPSPAPQRIRATVRADGSAVVVLPTGEVAEIRPSKDGHQTRWSWNILGTDDSDTWGHSYSQALAYRCACEASAKRCMSPARVAGFTAADALALEKVDRTAYTKRLKALLVQSTGHRGFSVRGSTGTAYSWIRVSGNDLRGRLWLAAIFGDSDPSIPPTRGYRAWYAARAAGLDASEIQRAEHAWADN